MKSLIAVLDRNLGRCPKCVQRAFLAALGTWVLSGVVAPEGASWARDALLVLALGLTGLWAAHVIALAARATGRALTKPSAHPVLVSIRPSRRQIVFDFARLVVLAAVATSVPRHASAQAKCGCRVGDVWCNPDTHVTYECQDVQGCTMWILTGHACTP